MFASLFLSQKKIIEYKLITMEATLEIATHFRDGTNLVGAEIAPELNYLWIVYWSKNLKWHSPRKI